MKTEECGVTQPPLKLNLCFHPGGVTEINLATDVMMWHYLSMQILQVRSYPKIEFHKINTSCIVGMCGKTHVELSL